MPLVSELAWFWWQTNIRLPPQRNAEMLKRSGSIRVSRTTTSSKGLAAILALSSAILGACAPPAPMPDGGPPDAPLMLPTLGLNDVSVLFPRPASLEDLGYLRPDDEGARGILLPQEVFDTVPGFPVVPRDGIAYARMRVLSLRFDACGGNGEVCVPQIRLVMQPIATDGTPRDSALHLFYALTDEELPMLVRELRQLRLLAPEVRDSPLDVHAALLAQGVEGAYGTALREVVLRYAGEQNLVRVTFFLRAPPTTEVWFFGGLERDGEGILRVMNIVGVGRGNQRVIRTLVADGYQFDVTPNATMPEDGSALLTSASAEAADDATRRAALASYLRLENPNTYVPDALPCAGCHLAGFITAEAERRFGLTGAQFPDDIFTSHFDLSVRGAALTTPSSLRAFGWFGDEPMIVPRTIHESAHVVEDIERRFPAR